MLSGFLGGLSNLGQVYSGFQQQNALNQLNQLRQQQLQQNALNQQVGPALLKLAGSGALSLPPQTPTTQAPQPTAPIPLSTAPTTTPGTPTAAPSPIPSVPDYSTALNLLQPPTTTPTQFGSGLASGLGAPQAGLGGTAAPSTALTGTGYGTGLDLAMQGQIPGTGGASRGLPGPTLAPPPTIGGLGPQIGQAGPFNFLTSTLDGGDQPLARGGAAQTPALFPPQPALFTPRQQPTTQAPAGAPDLAGRQNLLPQYDQLGSTRPLGPGEYITNSDGSWSSEYTVTVPDPNRPGQYMVVPSLWLVNGQPQILSEDQAAGTAANSGLNFPHFGSEKAAEAYSNRREAIWQKTPIGRSDAQAPLWSQPGGGGTLPATVDQGVGAQAPGGARTVRVSWFGNSPGWHDPSDTGTQASGLPVAGNPGIALPNRSTLGQIFDVTFPDGRTFRWPQTDTGPDPRTGRGVDINSAAAQQAGFTPGTFPTDAQVTVRPAGGGAVNAAYDDMNLNLPPVYHGIGDRGIAMLAALPQIPQAFKMADPQQIARAIDKALPGTSDDVKGAVFLKAWPMMNEQAKEQTAQAWEGWKAQMEQLGFIQKEEDITEQRAERRQEFDIRQQELQAYRAATLGKTGDEPLGGPVQIDSGQWVQPMRSGAPRPLPGTPMGIATAQTRIEADPRKAAFEAYKQEYAAAHEGKQPSADEQAAYMRKLYAPRSATGIGLQAFMEQFQQENGRPPNSDDIREYMAGTAAMTSEARTVGTAGANVDISATKAEAIIPLLKEKSKEINRTNYPDINSLILAYETKTGDPTVVQYGELVNALRYTYASVLSRGGQPRVADISHFDEVFNKNWSGGQVDAALDQIQTTINRERAAIIKTRQQVGKPPSQRPAAAEPPDTAIATMNVNQIEQLLKSGKATPQQLIQAQDRLRQLGIN